MRGAWIEMKTATRTCTAQGRRSPCGERGLKFQKNSVRISMRRMSLPVRGAWIEMAATRAAMRCACMSLPVRGAWIEIKSNREGTMEMVVAPRAGSVD